MLNVSYPYGACFLTLRMHASSVVLISGRSNTGSRGAMATMWQNLPFEWPVVRADMIVQLKLKLASGTLSPLGVAHARNLLRALQGTTREEEGGQT